MDVPRDSVISPGHQQRPSLMKVLTSSMGSAATGLWGLIQNAATGPPAASGSTAGPLAPVMQELASVYSPFPDSASANAHGKKGMAGIKVVVTAPRIKRHRSERQGLGGSGIKSPGGDDDDEALWEENQHSSLDISQRTWLRFIEPKSGSVLYMNMKTNSAQGDRPADYDGSDDEDDDFSSDDELDDVPGLQNIAGGAGGRGRGSISQTAAPGMPQPMNFASPRRARQESLILAEAWDENNHSGLKTPQSKSTNSGGSAPGSGGSIMGGHGPRGPVTPGGTASGIDPRLLAGGLSGNKASMMHSSQPREDEAFVPLSAADGKGGVGNAKVTVSIEGFLSSTMLYMKQLEQLLEIGECSASSELLVLIILIVFLILVCTYVLVTQAFRTLRSCLPRFA
jgi:hypothetical protein